jgi:hypothetical protein
MRHRARPETAGERQGVPARVWRSLLVARRTVLNEMRVIENVGPGCPAGG